jgi:dienelactone hydrolase
MDHFLARKSELVTVTERVVRKQADSTILLVTLEDERAIQVEGYLKVPDRGGPLHPVLIALGGAGTGRRSMDYLGDTRDWLVLALDYPYRGETEDMTYWEYVSIVPEARRAMLDTVPAGMLAVDYLWRRGDVDRNRIVLAGGSFGALFSPALAAADERISAVAILFGAGHLQDVISANLRMPWPLRPALSWVGSVLVSPVEPLKYVHRVSPRPIFMLCATEDEAMPEHCTRALIDKAGEPKTVRWLPLGHVQITSSEFHQQVLDECARWLQEIGFVSEGETFRVPERAASTEGPSL